MGKARELQVSWKNCYIIKQLVAPAWLCVPCSLPLNIHSASGTAAVAQDVDGIVTEVCMFLVYAWCQSTA
jgi:hypothetical protein